MRTTISPPPAASAPTRLADALDEVLAADLAHFAPPGHKRSAAMPFAQLLRHDIQLLNGVEDQRLSRRLLRQAEEALADAWGASWARLSVQGSTHANTALCLALARDGGELVVARHAHKSVLAGLVVSGLRPRWVVPEIDAAGVVGGIDPDRFAAALRAAADPVGALVVEPAYTGGISDLDALRAHAAARGVPLLVDQAWGAHLGFHPELPPSALSLGADVAVISLHKTLPAFTPAAAILAGPGAPDRGRLELAFDALHTTSPSAAVLASADRARAFMQRDGSARLQAALELATALRLRIDALPGVRCDDPAAPPPGARWSDPLKLVIDVGAAGVGGLELDRRLRASGVQVSMAAPRQLVVLITVADDARAADRLVVALERALADGADGSLSGGASSATALALALPPVALTPREAFLAAHDTVPLRAAAGRIAGELVAPYPPGVAAIVPGELIAADTVEALCELAAAGVRMTGCADPALRTLRVVA
ncbi:aminotransferase class I/II-fold pyridoxal phosphate-dependent enzyme [Conexibacter sp. CPCC 206217]|uniref:aminotransferase class I/II-fold pyridoxal phosphate-dependent enzyme n=1 Tax=Conexibacter sp. CPCC 206217 TaxID=3064574 RepID=UPI002721EE12|nr:hypothetical protein [Conexibacter sp. CPCC 206217]MDO8210247.1 hypothetical protein [Conexibacter sp. CPCC 206217]